MKVINLFVTIVGVVCVGLVVVKPVNAKLSAQQVRIVDCLLPGKVKKLGLNRVYLTKKRPTKTSMIDCSIRGGEYTAYDRSNIESALNVWLSSASLGNAEAQYYVGEIFERGENNNPDYKKALLWYQQSADQDYKPALMALGKFYEGGLGVKKDLVKAMNYYRQASGLDDERIEYASVFEEVREEDVAKINTLELKLAQEEKNTARLTADIKKLHDKFNSSNNKIRRLESDIQNQKNKIRDLNQSADNYGDAGSIKIKQELDLAKSQLQDQQQRILTLSTELSLARKSEDTNAQQVFFQEQLKLQADELKKQETISQHKIQEATKFNNELQALSNSLLRYSADERVKRVRGSFEKEKQWLQGRLDQANKDKRHYEEKISVLQSKINAPNNDSLGPATNYRYQLEKARIELRENESKFTKYEKQKARIAQLQKQLNEVKYSTNNNVVVLQNLLTQSQASYESEVTKLKAQLQNKEATISTLKKRFTIVKASQGHKQNYVNDLQSKIEEAKLKQKRISKLVKEKNTSLDQAYAQIDFLKKQLKELPNQQELQQLNITLANKQAALEKEKKRSVELNNNIIALQEKNAGSEARLAKIAPDDSPVISIRWPKNKNGTKAIVGAGSIVNVVGAVYPVKTIVDFKINGVAEPLDTNGLFIKEIEVANTPVRLELVAVNDLGKQSKHTLIVEPSAQAEYLSDSSGQLTIPKVRWGNFYALVIGNNNYKQTEGWMPLDTAVNDAQAISKVLNKQYGFKVTTKLNASRDEILIALEELRKKLTEKDNLIVYYAGHGYMDPENDQGYWIPINASGSSTVNWISNATITDQIRAMSARNVMVIADSCYSASLMRSGIVNLRSGLSPEKKMQRLKEDVNIVTRMALSSGGLQPVADAVDNSGHSVFANALLKSLQNNRSILDGDSLATEVGLNVTVATQNNVQQVPRYAPLARGGHQGGEFYFVSKN